jgi:hypothetical protein
MKRVVYIILLMVFFSSCEQWIIQDENSYPQPHLPQIGNFKPNFSFFYPISSQSQRYTNWNTVVRGINKLESNFNAYSLQFRIFEQAAKQEPKRFSDKSWYWKVQIDTASYVLYLTYLDIKTLYCEAYRSSLPKQTHLGPRLIYGRFSVDNKWGELHFKNSSDSLHISWQSTKNFSQTSYGFLPASDTLIIVPSAQYKYFYTLNGGRDSVEIYINSYNGQGKALSYYLFGDRKWHCWDERHQNCMCDIGMKTF